MDATFQFDDRVAMVTGACGALGSAVSDAFRDAGATVVACDVLDVDAENSLLEAGEGIEFVRADLTDEEEAERAVTRAVDDHGRLDALCNVAGTWRGGDRIDETDAEQFDLLMDVNLRTMFHASKHAIPHLRETGGAVVSVSARASLEGGEGDGIYRASKAGVRLLTDSIAAENRGEIRANAVMPSVLDTPDNREMMEPSDDWVDPADVAQVMLFLCSDAAKVTSGAAVPVYGEA